MANYQRGTRVQSVVDFRESYPNQSESAKFQVATRDICTRAGVSPSQLVNFALAFVNEDHREAHLRDLVEVMLLISREYNLGLGRDDKTLYQAVKGLPFFSKGRLGYTFHRNRRGKNRGVFLFAF